MDTLDEKTRESAQALMKCHPEITENTIEGMISAFAVMDTDGNKMIEKAELEKHLQIIGCNPTPQQVDDMIKKLDVSGDGKVDLAEFFTLAAHLKIGQAEKDDLTKAFKVFDKDKNGKICKSELKTVLKDMQQFTDDEEIDLMMESADKNGDGYLDIKELVDLFSSPT